MTQKLKKLNIDQDICRTHYTNVNKMLRQARLNYYLEKNRIVSAKHLLEGPNEGFLHIDKMSADLAQDFRDFFINNIETIRNDITSKSTKSKSSLNTLL